MTPTNARNALRNTVLTVATLAFISPLTAQIALSSTDCDPKVPVYRDSNGNSKCLKKQRIALKVGETPAFMVNRLQNLNDEYQVAVAVLNIWDISQKLLDRDDSRRVTALKKFSRDLCPDICGNKKVPSSIAIYQTMSRDDLLLNIHQAANDIITGGGESENVRKGRAGFPVNVKKIHDALVVLFPKKSRHFFFF